jgi:hypothetical protein
LVFVGFSFVRQLFSPVERPTVMAGPGGRLPAPLSEKGAESEPVRTATVPITVPPPPVPMSNKSQASPATVVLQDAPLADPNEPITEATHDEIVYRLISAKTQGNRLTIRLQVTNRGTDRLLEISSLPWSKTLFYNERSEVYRPDDVQIGNSRGNSSKTRAMLVASVPAQIVLAYSELPMVAGSLSFRKIALLQLDVALFSTDQAYRNAFADPIAISRPTFRMISITDGAVSAASGVMR